jgi:hypothetical protein
LAVFCGDPACEGNNFSLALFVAVCCGFSEIEPHYARCVVEAAVEANSSSLKHFVAVCCGCSGLKGTGFCYVMRGAAQGASD